MSIVCAPIIEIIAIIITVSQTFDIITARRYRNRRDMRGMSIHREIAISFARANTRNEMIKSRDDFNRHAHRRRVLTVPVSVAGLTLTRSGQPLFHADWKVRARAHSTGRLFSPRFRVNKSTRTVINGTAWYSKRRRKN